MSKVKIIDKKSEKSILDERDLLSKLKHPFIVNMLCAFQDYENLYLLMDLLTGGDLRYHYNSNHIFSEKEIRFFISCLILSLEYIHENNIIHRDIKPENLIYDEKGYVRLTDFGIAKIKKEKLNDTSGTPGYMAPEVLLGQNHSFPVDFYAIGVIGYEFLMVKTPYVGKNRKEIKQLVLSKEVYIDNNNDNKEGIWSRDCINFINSCLKRDLNNRLGYHFGIKELKTHPWFSKYDWSNLYNKKIIAPYIPKNEQNYDKKYCESLDKISNSTFERYKGYMRKSNYMKIFEGYTYFYNDLHANTVENETVTRVSTSTKGNKQELFENQSFGNIYPSIIKVNNYSITPLKNMIESSISSNKGHNSVDNKFMIWDKKKDEENQNIENYQYHVQSNMVNSRAMMILGQNKRILNKKQISVDILNINKKIKEEINSRITENNYNSHIHNNSSTKKDSFDFKNDINNIINVIDNSNVNIYNKVLINNNNENSKIFYNNVNNREINNINIIKNLNEINLFNKIKKRNISNSSLNEKQIKIDNDKLEQLGKNINKSVFDFRKFKKKKLNIHSLCGGTTQTKELNIEDKKNDEKILPILLPPLIKANNNNSYNQSQNMPLFLSNIKHFKFKITKKKRIKHISFNQNKIIENAIKTNEEKQKKPIIQIFSQNIKNVDNDNDNDNNNNNNNNNNNININHNNSGEQKSDIYKKLINNGRLKNKRIQLGKSHSTGLFPKIKIT